MDLKSEFIFDYLKKYIAEQGSLIVNKIKAIFHFYVSKYTGDSPTCFTINLKEGNGSVSKGKEGKADASIIINDADLVDLAMGKLKPKNAIMNVCFQGKMKIKGNYFAALKVTPEMIPLFPKL